MMRRAGTMIGVMQMMTSPVSDGLFNVLLNDLGQFGLSAFDGNRRWLAVNVRCPGGSGSFSACWSGRS